MATLKSFFAPAKKEDSFEEWGVRNLGRTLYDLCFGIYSERVWGLPTSQISSKQAQRVAKLNLKNIILRTLGIKADPATYFTKYFYPRKGISRSTRAWRRKCGGRQHGAAELAGGARRARRRQGLARGLQDGRGEQTIECDICCRRCRCRRSST
jgi:protoporphyrinogen oxidase